MILIINGSFGVGKTTVAHLLKRQITGSRLYNPEWTGSIFMRLPSLIKLQGGGTDDFQDIRLWRKSVVGGTKIFRAFTRGPVIVPMAFSRIEYLDEITCGMREFDNEIKVYCLIATLPTILKRLEQRGEKIEDAENNWIVRKAHECVEAHSRNTHFGEHVYTEEASANEVATSIIKRLKYTKPR